MLRWRVGVASLLVGFAAAACVEAPAAPSAPTLLAIGERYVEDTAFRRALLEDSLVNANNGYSVRRLQAYAVTDEAGNPAQWDARPVWNPPVARWNGSAPQHTEPLPSLGVPADHDALIALGRQAFERYPAQRLSGLESVAGSPDSAVRAGLWVDAQGWIGGLVQVVPPSGQTPYLAATCATCHARVDAGQLHHGVANQALDLGAVFARQALDQERYERLLAWGPGRVDVTPVADDPAAISDLRPIANQHRLHWAGTVQNSFGALLVRVETLLITSSATHRPPREVVYALAYYLWHLSPAATRPPDARTEAGATLFSVHCAGCHAVDGRPIAAAAIAQVGTDPVLAQSPDRGTGAWRVPSLQGVSTRGRLLHDLSAMHLRDLLDPARQSRAPGHAFGTALSEPEREALVRYLETLGAPPSGASPSAGPPSR